MNDNTRDLLILGGGAAALLVVAAVVGQQQSNGIAFSQANPQSVAAVESAVASEETATQNAANTKIQDALTFALGLAGLQEQVTAAQIDLQKTGVETAAQTAQVGLQTSAQINETQLNDSAALQKAQLDDNATEAVASTVSQANQAIAQLNATAQQNISNNQTTQVQAQAGASKTNGILGTIGSVIGSVLGFFSPTESGNTYPVTDPNSAIDAVGDALPPVAAAPITGFTPVSP